MNDTLRRVLLNGFYLAMVGFWLLFGRLSSEIPPYVAF